MNSPHNPSIWELRSILRNATNNNNEKKMSYWNNKQICHKHHLSTIVFQLKCISIVKVKLCSEHNISDKIPISIQRAISPHRPKQSFITWTARNNIANHIMFGPGSDEQILQSWWCDSVTSPHTIWLPYSEKHIKTILFIAQFKCEFCLHTWVVWEGEKERRVKSGLRLAIASLGLVPNTPLALGEMMSAKKLCENENCALSCCDYLSAQLLAMYFFLLLLLSFLCHSFFHFSLFSHTLLWVMWNERSSNMNKALLNMHQILFLFHLLSAEMVRAKCVIYWALWPMTDTHISSKNMYNNIISFFYYLAIHWHSATTKPIIIHDTHRLISMIYIGIYIRVHTTHTHLSKTAYISLWKYFSFVWNFSNIFNKNILFGHQSVCHLCIRCV